MFRVADYAFNWAILDAAPGVHICDEATLPLGWGTDQTGRLAFTNDEQRLLCWEGDGWHQVNKRGHLGGTSTTGPQSTTSTTYTVALSVPVEVFSAVAVMIVVEGPSVANTNGLTEIGIFRDNTSVQQWSQPGRSGSVPTYERPRPLAMVAIDVPGGAGSYNYSLQYRVEATTLGTSTLGGSATAPLSLSIIEC